MLKFLQGASFPAVESGWASAAALYARGKKLWWGGGVDDLNAQYIPRRMVFRNPSVQ